MLWSIWTVSSSFVGSTITFWNRRSSAPSFSIYWRYSSSVVAPMHCISPRAKAGFSMFAASSEPLAPPAPTSVCISSINRITFVACCNSFRIAFIRSSNCPRYFVPATIEPKSSVNTRLPKSARDTLRFVILIARPSTIADLPTPGSPISIGLFFLRRLNICTNRSISLSRPTIGSNRFSSAAFVRSVPKLSITGVSEFGFVCCCLPLCPRPPTEPTNERSSSSPYGKPAWYSSSDAISTFSNLMRTVK